MKGKLKKTENGWFVEYDAELAGENIWVELLPVYYETWMLTSTSLIEGGNVTFEKIIKPFDVNGVNDVTYCAKIIRSKSVVDALKPYSDITYPKPVEMENKIPTAEEIFEKHIGLNAELGYIPINKDDVIDAMEEYATQCQEDMDKKYTKDDVIELFRKFGIENRNISEDENSWIELKSKHIEEWIHNKLNK